MIVTPTTANNFLISLDFETLLRFLCVRIVNWTHIIRVALWILRRHLRWSRSFIDCIRPCMFDILDVFFRWNIFEFYGNSLGIREAIIHNTPIFSFFFFFIFIWPTLHTYTFLNYPVRTAILVTTFAKPILLHLKFRIQLIIMIWIPIIAVTLIPFSFGDQLGRSNTI